MALPKSPTPERVMAGFSTDPPYGPLADCGMPNPFFYHEFEDDFDMAVSLYTATKTGNGTIAHNAADGGKLLFTTNSSTPAGTDLCSIQLPAASFSLPVAGKKLFYLARLQVHDAANCAFAAGLMNTTATPFAPTDGLYFYKASGGAANLVLRSTVTSVNTDLVIPTADYTLANDTDIDLAFYINYKGELLAYVGSQLVGYVPQSGTGSSVPPRGPMARSTPTFTAVVLNPTLALQSGTASSKTMTADFHGVLKER